VTIKGNVISCDECGRQISAPMEPDGGKQSLDELVRAYAANQGWTLTDEADICPDHQG
jgi:hypothetical protein